VPAAGNATVPPPPTPPPMTPPGSPGTAPTAPQAPDLQSQARQAIALSLGGKHQNVRQAPMTGGGIGFTFGERLPGQGPSHAQQEGLREAYTGLPPGARAPSTNRPVTDLSAPPPPTEIPTPPPPMPSAPPLPTTPPPQPGGNMVRLHMPAPGGGTVEQNLPGPGSQVAQAPAPPPMPEAPTPPPMPKSRAVANISRPDLGKPGERATL